MKIFRHWKAIAAIALCMSILFTQPIFAQTVDDLKNEAEALEGEKNEINQQIADTDKRIAEKEAELSRLNEQISEIEGEIDVLNTTIYSCTQKIAELEDDIVKKQEEIEEDYETLRGRIRTIYMSGGTSDLEVLLGAKTFDEFIDATALVSAVSKHDKRLIDELKDNIATINGEISEVESQKAELVSAKEEMEATREELDGLKIEADAAAKELRTLKGSLTEEVHQITAEQEQLYAQIEEMIRKQQEEEERRKREEEERRQQQMLQQNQSNGSSGGSSGGTVNSFTPGGASGYASYVWPAPECTVITSYWGDNRGHQGIDLACYGSAYGKSIVAAASGTVTIANSSDSWGSGWGYYVMINHGGGYSTLYAHCSQVLVSPGQYVSAGQLIGYIGNTGNSYGAHLHFETWYNSTRYNPAPHLGL